MANSPKLQFSETDLTLSTGVVPKGISAVIGLTKKGPLNSPNLLITSFEQFRSIYGDLQPNNDFPLLCKRALERGSALRVVSIKSADAAFATTQASYTGTVAASGTPTAIGITFGGGITQSQAFTVSVAETLRLLAIKLKAAYPTIFQAITTYSNILLITFKPGMVLVPIWTFTGTAPVATFISMLSATDSASNAVPFILAPKYPGSIYNNLIYSILPPSNGATTGAFDLRIEVVGDNTSQVELYKNLSIPLTASLVTIANSVYLDEVKQNSQLVNVLYQDISTQVGAYIPPVGQTGYPLYLITLGYNLGFDGAALTDTDYINALPKLNSVDDIMQFAAPNFSGNNFHIAAAAYATNRKDLVYFAHLSNTLTTENALVAAKDALNIDSSYVAFYAGGLIIADPFTGADRQISEMGDILGAASLSDSSFGEWYSFAGPRRGIISNALGVQNNFGALSNQGGLDLVANHQINLVINRQNKIMIWGNFTGQLANTTLSFLNVRRLNIYIKKALAPVLLQFIEEPNDIPTWKNIFLTVQPELENLKTKRGIYDYKWQGDQFANTLNDLIINNKAQVQQGKYRVRLFVKQIVSLQEFAIDITLTSSSVSFEDALTLITA